jgi:hypothetical protein
MYIRFVYEKRRMPAEEKDPIFHLLRREKLEKDPIFFYR